MNMSFLLLGMAAVAVVAIGVVVLVVSTGKNDEY